MINDKQRDCLKRLANRMRLLSRDGGIWAFDVGEREEISTALDLLLCEHEEWDDSSNGAGHVCSACGDYMKDKESDNAVR